MWSSGVQYHAGLQPLAHGVAGLRAAAGAQAGVAQHETGQPSPRASRLTPCPVAEVARKVRARLVRRVAVASAAARKVAQHTHAAQLRRAVRWPADSSRDPALQAPSRYAPRPAIHDLQPAPYALPPSASQPWRRRRLARRSPGGDAGGPGEVFRPPGEGQE